jgi:uncharacterized Zn-binding protein involved in type VI secretion
MSVLSPVARLGDTSSHGGTIISASTHKTADGRGIARSGDDHSCPLPGHGITALSATSVNTCDGRQIVRIGDVAGCGAVISSGSPVVSSH